MITIRKSADRGKTKIDWLESYHSFSFGSYHDDEHMGFRDLRVINEDFVAPGTGFAPHRHRDMEIVTYVLEGALEHKDSLGNGSVIIPGDVQRMSAGSGIQHSEFNPSSANRVHLLQIWILPSTHGESPGYEQKRFEQEQKLNRFCLIASKDGRDGSVTINQEASIYASVITKGRSLEYTLAQNCHAWIQIVRGEVEISGYKLSAGDAVAISHEAKTTIVGLAEDSELLIFDLA